VSADARDLVEELYETPLEPDEFERRLEALRADVAEVAEMDALIAWFVRRYPTMEARLGYARRHGKRLKKATRAAE
jgi:hypothetical protein